MQLDEVKIVPRPRKHTSPATLQREVTLDAQLLQGLFHVRQEEAAEQLGVCLTSFKAACRRLGIQRWPYTKGMSQRNGRPGVPSRESQTGSESASSPSPSSASSDPLADSSAYWSQHHDTENMTMQTRRACQKLL
ncbi:hypothetical protein GUITHDRAFT_111246 [Guillardia theta CCMP2712]|uniref:RWP-RK domain-containing protein n=1 Tax=Guillardia theta (strain CCMP2712) TaxID=905079 RepID=L1J425_GUITC|nr:hypothetical protein GUITHDRAFT_111246 [Guillardia theta CCMP2712]EKX42879.1 hypothetical protein GUITHDRAFT_111246 [Guillardia theta CCMP2712]|eukprot:XP_005829859.1 hypothetical protein GUITHDRAFT_111246 [Guillardia theta CCMP2712]